MAAQQKVNRGSQLKQPLGLRPKHELTETRKRNQKHIKNNFQANNVKAKKKKLSKNRNHIVILSHFAPESNIQVGAI